MVQYNDSTIFLCVCVVSRKQMQLLNHRKEVWDLQIQTKNEFFNINISLNWNLTPRPSPFPLITCAQRTLKHTLIVLGIHIQCIYTYNYSAVEQSNKGLIFMLPDASCVSVKSARHSLAVYWLSTLPLMQCALQRHSTAIGFSGSGSVWERVSLYLSQPQMILDEDNLHKYCSLCLSNPQTLFKLAIIKSRMIQTV